MKNELFNSVGFKSVKTSKEEEVIYGKVLDDASWVSDASDSKGYTYSEFYKSFGKSIGVSIKGCRNENDKIVSDDFVPYAKTDRKTKVSFVALEIEESTNSYYLICEDGDTHTEYILYLQNANKYFSLEKSGFDFRDNLCSLNISALSTEGTVILPVEKDDEIRELDRKEDIRRRGMIKKAKMGDKKAAKELEIEAEKSMNIIQERLKEEDFLSVVEQYMLPLEEDTPYYNILGEIKDVMTLVNEYTHELVYWFEVDFLGRELDLFINSDDLIGVPSRGMRFLGKCYLQGFINS